MTPEQRQAAADRWAMIGATLQDVGGGIGGGDTGAIARTRQAQIGRQKLAQQQAMLAGLFQQDTPDAQVAAPPPVQASGMFGAQEAAPSMAPISIPQAPRRSVPTLQDPQTIQKLFGLHKSGMDIGSTLDLLKASDAANKVEVTNGVAYNPFSAKPGDRIGVNLQNVNGFQVDTQDPNNANRFLPKIEDGSVPLYDGSGQVVAQRLLDGTVQAIGQREGARAGAVSAAQAPFDLQTVDSPNGGKIIGSRADILGMGPIQSQTPVDAKRADATFEAQSGFPQVAATAQQTLDLIGQLRNHPGRKSGTGMTGVLPAIPGSDTKDFTTLLKQASGQTFLAAYNQIRGAGAITDIEGKKAEEAIARLDRMQSEEGFLSALKDLESVITAGLARAQQKAQPSTTGGRRGPPSVGEVQQGYRFKGGNPANPSSWERAR